MSETSTFPSLQTWSEIRLILSLPHLILTLRHCFIYSNIQLILVQIYGWNHLRSVEFGPAFDLSAQSNQLATSKDVFVQKLLHSCRSISIVRWIPLSSKHNFNSDSFMKRETYKRLVFIHLLIKSSNVHNFETVNLSKQ